jgi:VWFA-related protein
MRKTLVGIAITFALATPSWGQQEAVVTVLNNNNAPVTGITSAQVSVEQGGHADAVTAITPLQGQAGRIEMFLALDEDAVGLAPRMPELQAFLKSQPADVATGVVYLRQSTALLAQPLTTRHDAAAATLRPPLATQGISPSPFESLTALAASWPQRPNRRRVLVVLSNGVQSVGGDDAENQQFRKALDVFAGAGVLIYAILVPGSESISAGSTDHDGAANGLASPSLVQGNGFANLTTLAEQTGGEAFSEGSGVPNRLQPFLDQITSCLRSQYRVQFTPQPGSSGVAGIKINVKGSHLRVFAPRKIAVAGRG